MKKKIIFILLSVVFIFIWYSESRKFICLNNGKCVTVWKTINNICYIIPGKYFGIIKPSTYSYIKTSNVSNIDIIWSSNSNNIIVNSDDSTININNYSQGVQVINYSQNKIYNDATLMFFDGKYHRYKKEITFINISIKENYAVDMNGKKL